MVKVSMTLVERPPIFIDLIVAFLCRQKGIYYCRTSIQELRVKKIEYLAEISSHVDLEKNELLFYPMKSSSTITATALVGSSIPIAVNYFVLGNHLMQVEIVTFDNSAIRDDYVVEQVVFLQQFEY